MSYVWSGDVGLVLVRTSRTKAHIRTRREGVTQYCPEIADDDMGQTLGPVTLEENRHAAIEFKEA